MKIDGVQIAKTFLSNLKQRVLLLKKEGVVPHLVVILIGNDPASISYVNQKEIKGKRIGAKITIKHISRETDESALLETIKQLNNDNNIHGIIVQRPLPINIDTNAVSLIIDPKKDVDGFHPKSKFSVPVAAAVLRILENIHRFLTPRMVAKASDFRLLRGGFREWLTSKKIVVLGKGETGGKPVIEMFEQMSIEPQVIDSKTKNSEALTKKADIIISTVGKPDIVKPEMLKREVILIGVGLHKGSDGKLHGDYEDDKIKNIASFYTPTPGGVGPLNVAMLLKNLVAAAENFYLSASTEA